MPFPFGLGDHFPNIVQVGKKTPAHINGLSPEGLCGRCRLRHPSETLAQGVIDELLE